MDLIEKAKKIEYLSSKLGLAIPIVYLHIEHRDKDGVLYPNGDYYNVSRSWVRNAYNQILSRMGGYYPRDASPNWGTGYINMTDTSGTIRSSSSQCFAYGAGISAQRDDGNVETSYGYAEWAATTLHGILVGTGTNEESFEDYALQTLIAHGTTSGKLSYAVCNINESDNGLVHKASWSRVITHGGNGQPNVVITEVCNAMVLGLVTTPYYFLMLRDILDFAIVMSYLDALTVTYEITLTYPG